MSSTLVSTVPGQESLTQDGLVVTTDASPDSQEAAEPTRVLVADGNPTVRKILRHTFTALGWESVEAEDGERWLLTLGDRITDALALPPER